MLSFVTCHDRKHLLGPRPEQSLGQEIRHTIFTIEFHLWPKLKDLTLLIAHPIVLKQRGANARTE
jgi:hypothetical protein